VREGLYLVFEGIVGAGKTTLSKKLHSYLQQQYPHREVIWTREPGGTEIAENIRRLVQGTVFQEEMHPYCEAYLYAAARAQSLPTTVSPVLNQGGIVVSDRSFITSLAFQGTARDLGLETVLQINRTLIDQLLPDQVIFLDVEPATGLARTSDHNGDKFEQEPIDFFQHVRNGYLQIAQLPIMKKRWLTIDVNHIDEETTLHRIISQLQLPTVQ